MSLNLCVRHGVSQHADVSITTKHTGIDQFAVPVFILCFCMIQEEVKTGLWYAALYGRCPLITPLVEKLKSFGIMTIEKYLTDDIMVIVLTVLTFSLYLPPPPTHYFTFSLSTPNISLCLHLSTPPLSLGVYLYPSIISHTFLQQSSLTCESSTGCRRYREHCVLIIGSVVVVIMAEWANHTYC